MAETSVEQADQVAAGWEALARGAWAQASEHFQAALAAAETAEALEGLGAAAFWLDDPQTLEIRKRAYRAYRECGDRAGAARAALALSWDTLAFRGDDAVAKGWLELAGRLLEGLPTAPERGWLAMQTADFAIEVEHDPVEAQRWADRTVEIGQAIGVSDIELLGLALQGISLVSQGRVAEGMRRRDTATAAAVAGEISDIAAAGYACCYLILACEKVRDLPRAAQWCEKLAVFCRRWGFLSLFHYCRVHYAGVLVEKGDWSEAEETITAAVEGLQQARPAVAIEALVRLAELRRRQGRLQEAAALLAEAEPLPAAQLCRAAVALDDDHPSTAVATAERYLRQLPAGDRTGRADGLEVLVHARAALGHVDAARTALSELREIADQVGTRGLRAAAAAAADAVVQLAAGDAEAACRAAEDAVDGYDRAGAPFGAARARVLLARVLRALGDDQAAEREAQSAARAFDHLGSSREADLARAMEAATPTPRSPLTRREIEVLRLVAAGMNNGEIAAKLVLSEHTVHRHVANILTKLGVPTRAAAVAEATRLGLL
jgi:LuxR family maltose regulon positive regulatory protein